MGSERLGAFEDMTASVIWARLLNESVSETWITSGDPGDRMKEDTGMLVLRG